MYLESKEMNIEINDAIIRAFSLEVSFVHLENAEFKNCGGTSLIKYFLTQDVSHVT